MLSKQYFQSQNEIYTHRILKHDVYKLVFHCQQEFDIAFCLFNSAKQ